MFHGICEARHVSNTAIVHQEHTLWTVSRQASDGIDELLGIELRRSGGWKNEGTSRGVELAIGDAEGVARKDVASFDIDESLVMQCMTRRMHDLERTTGKIQTLAIHRLHDALSRNGHQIP